MTKCLYCSKIPHEHIGKVFVQFKENFSLCEDCLALGQAAVAKEYVKRKIRPKVVA